MKLSLTDPKSRPGLVLLALLVLASPLPGRGDNKKTRAFALLEDARQVSDICASGMRPFLLVERIHTSGTWAGKRDGREIWTWASPDRWREEISLTNFREVRVGEPGKKLWLWRNRAYIPYGSGEDNFPLAMNALRTDIPGLKVNKVSKEKVGGIASECISLSGPHALWREVCLNAADHTLVRVREPGDVTEYSDYRSFEGKRVPWLITSDKQGQKEVQQLTEVTAEPHPDPSQFAPPPGSLERPGCADPSNPTAQYAPNPATPVAEAGGRASSGSLYLWFTIASSGRVIDVRVARPSAYPDFDRAAAEIVRKRWMFTPAYCGTTPVPSEMPVEFSFQIF